MIVRAAVLGDAGAMADLVNEIIRIGGTTAHEDEMTADQIAGYYIEGPDVFCGVVAVEDGRLIGFQSVGRHPALPDGWGDIGTYVAPDMQRKGTGAALFAATCVAARVAGLQVINATIRADNAPGLASYARRRFVDYALDPAFSLRDGRQVGRVSRRFDLV
ncbi:MAG: GNAT family N-acetyltransferase [Paracoccaceae bacterium]